MSSFQEHLQRFDYAFPQELIATAPANPRDSAKLLIYNRETKQMDWSTFAHIGEYLPKNSVLVLNQTKVIPARLRLTRDTGGMVDVLSLGTTAVGMRILTNKKLRIGEFLTLEKNVTLSSPADRSSIRPHSVRSTQSDTSGHIEAGFTVIEHTPRQWLLKPSFDLSELQSVFEAHGTMPLPPYIKDSPLSEEELREQYQSVFAKNPGSIAAPTASLHFTEELLASLEERGITLAYVTLHVHLGTFSPLKEEQWEKGELHEEEYVIDAETAQVLGQAKAEGRPIIAVGTTALRTLESASDAQGKITKPEGSTKLFIKEGYKFHLVDGLVTNFHVPKSSLLMLVSAFAGRDVVMDLYKQAIEKQFKLFSFGDGMLIL